MSSDLLHWREGGPVLERHPDAAWLGTGMIHRADDWYAMIFSEERPAGRQVVCFARSRDLEHWERHPAEYDLYPDPRFYQTQQEESADPLPRWDSVGVIPPAAPGDGRRIWIGWMSNWAYASEVPTSPWQGAMTLPREVRLRRLAEGVRLTQVPISELHALRTREAHWADVPVTSTRSFHAEQGGDALEIVADLEQGSAAECGVRIRYGASQQAVIGYDAGQRILFVDRTRSGKTDFSPVFAGRHGGPLSPRDGKVTLHIFVDRSSVEVFGNDGEAVVTSLVFPDTAATDVELYAHGGECLARSLDLFHLRSIWE